MLRNATAAHDALQSLQPWRKAGHWERLMDAIIAAHDVDVQVIDASIVRANLRARRLKGGVEIDVWGAPRRPLHPAVVDKKGRPIKLKLTAGQSKRRQN
jgi:transposase